MLNDRFRFDINGLRAVAVIGVVLYHFGFGLLRGGFSGVDVFFVISGYLMAGIIDGRLAADRFSLAGFFAARIRRIVPALAILVVCVLVCGILLLDPLRLDVLAGNSVASLLFYSNAHYLMQSGYFAAAAHQNWLLQTWSLSVEWQFYILFPILLVVLKRFGAGRTGTMLVLATLMALSFAKALMGSFAGGQSLFSVFFLLPGRAWEFLVGALCAYAPVSRLPAGLWRTLAHYAGLAAILAGMVLLDASTAWPSALTLLPVLGTALVIVAGCKDAGWSRLPLPRIIGLWSYSIYLWHWPIIAILSTVALTALPIRLAGLAAALALAGLSYDLIETRTSAFVWASRRRIVTVGLPLFALPLALGLLASMTNGLESVRYAFRPELRAELADYRAAMADWGFPKTCDHASWSATNFSVCTMGNPAARSVLVIGDSYAEQLTSRYKDVMKGSRDGITFVTRGGCFQLPGVDRFDAGSNCARWNEEAYAYAAREHFKRVVFIGFWSSYTRTSLCFVAEPNCGTTLDDQAFAAVRDAAYRAMSDRWRALEAQGKKVIVMDMIPFGGGDPRVLYQRAIDGDPVQTIALPLESFNRDRRDSTVRLRAAAMSAGAELVDPATSLCPAGACPIVEHGRTLYVDNVHLRSSIMTQPRFAFLDRYLRPD